MKLDTNTGLVDGAKFVPSPNYDERAADCQIDLLVIHNISLPPGEFGGPYIEQLFTNCLNADDHPYFREIHQMEVSAHFLIRRNGEIIQFVPTTKRAWHAGKSEFCGRQACNNFSIGIELEGSDETPYADAQYEQLCELTAAIRRAYPDITPAHIVGHCDIAPDRKTDPGSAFDWVRYKNQLS